LFSPNWCREKGVGAFEGEGRVKKGEGRELGRENWEGCFLRADRKMKRQEDLGGGYLY
jgi:hypothetical protein